MRAFVHLHGFHSVFSPLLYKISFTLRKWQNTLNKHPHTLHLSTHSLKNDGLIYLVLPSAGAQLLWISSVSEGFIAQEKPVGLWHAETALTHSYTTKVQTKERDWNRAGSISGASTIHAFMGNTSITEGKTALSLGASSIARGKTSITMGKSSITRGVTTTSMGDSTITRGKTTISLGRASFSRGKTTTSFGKALMSKRRTT